jgi:hypothetical protein
MKGKQGHGPVRSDALAQRYGKVEIPAVAAAARYQKVNNSAPAEHGMPSAQPDEKLTKEKQRRKHLAAAV